MKRKKRQTKKIYLIREIREIFDRLPTLGKLKWNKILAHCLDEHSQEFTKDQVIEALWAFYWEINQANGRSRFALIPIDTGEFVKVDNSPEGRDLVEAYRRKTAEKDLKRNTCHAEYVKADVSKHLFSRPMADKILALSSLDPKIKELNP